MMAHQRPLDGLKILQACSSQQHMSILCIYAQIATGSPEAAFFFTGFLFLFFSSVLATNDFSPSLLSPLASPCPSPITSPLMGLAAPMLIPLSPNLPVPILR
jgi:hypothetical protein